MIKQVNSNLILDIKLLDDREDTEVLHDIMCRLNSSLGGLTIVAGYIRYDTFHINKKEQNEEIKLNKNINVNQAVKYEKNKKVDNCKMF
jgi:hypothetical protein